FDKRSLDHAGSIIKARDNHEAKPLTHQNLMELQLIGEKNDTAVLKIWSFYPNAAIATPTNAVVEAEVKAWWQYLLEVEEYIKKNKVNRLIFDLRNNAGGLINFGF